MSYAAEALPLPQGGVATSSIICSQMIDRLGDFFELGVFFWGRFPWASAGGDAWRARGIGGPGLFGVRRYSSWGLYLKISLGFVKKVCYAVSLIDIHSASTFNTKY